MDRFAGNSTCSKTECRSTPRGGIGKAPSRGDHLELSIDTSTRYALVGLSQRGETLGELAWRSQRNHSVELVPAIRDLMGRLRIRMHQLDAIFVAGGPGGFSALRVGMSTSKAMATALNIPLAVVGTLDVEAMPYRVFGLPIKVLIEAGKNRLYVGKYSSPPDETVTEYAVMGYDEFVSSIDSSTFFCGEAISQMAGLLRDRLGRKALIAEVRPPTRRASVLAQLGHAKWQMGATEDPATVQPLYLRSAQVNMAHRTWEPTRGP